MKLEKRGIPLLKEAVEVLEKGFVELPEVSPDVDFERIAPVLMETAEALRDNYPYFHPLYAGQMLKPAHPIAHLAYMLAMWINPNNHALDGGRASSHMEKEAVAQIAKMFGWKTHLGHLTGGGTMANMEALWVSGRLQPGKLIVASDQAHYTHNRITQVLKLPFHSVETDDRAKMDLNWLEDILKKGNVGTVVATMGTTATGSVDPLDGILSLREKYGFRVHADAAYGGYFVLAENLPEETKAAYQNLSKVDSVAIDPHKHGLQPYVAGCIIFRDPGVGQLYKHDSPYTYFSSKELHLGEISLECSRAGASAVALWATQRLFPLERGGEFAGMLEKCRAAAVRFYEKLADDPDFAVAFPPELDIVNWVPRREGVSSISEASTRMFETAEENHLYLALASLPVRFLQANLRGVEIDHDTVTCLRSCFMKPEHLNWVDRIYERVVTLKI
jgi:glutamate/tyrosine decarboxylase-like PLP-dependent enzyme